MIVFDRAKGAAAELVRNNPNALVLILLKTAEADATLEGYSDMATLLAAAGNVEADFTGYTRKTGIAGTATIDGTNHVVNLTAPKQTWAGAGGTTNNTMAKAIFAIQTATAGDAGLIPLTAHDYTATTDGSNDLVIDNSGTNPFYDAA